MTVNIVDDTPVTGRTTSGVKAMALDDNAQPHFSIYAIVVGHFLY